MSFTLCAEPVRTLGTAASNPTNPAVESNLMDVVCFNIFRPSLFDEQWIEPCVPVEI
jgi:hypothetical protein